MSTAVVKEEILVLKMIIFCIFIIILCLLFRSCAVKNIELTRERASKCFEQTQDKNCWGINEKIKEST